MLKPCLGPSASPRWIPALLALATALILALAPLAAAHTLEYAAAAAASEPPRAGGAFPGEALADRAAHAHCDQVTSANQQDRTQNTRPAAFQAVGRRRVKPVAYYRIPNTIIV